LALQHRSDGQARICTSAAPARERRWGGLWILANWMPGCGTSPQAATPSLADAATCWRAWSGPQALPKRRAARRQQADAACTAGRQAARSNSSHTAIAVSGQFRPALGGHVVFVVTITTVILIMQFIEMASTSWVVWEQGRQSVRRLEQAAGLIDRRAIATRLLLARESSFGLFSKPVPRGPALSAS